MVDSDRDDTASSDEATGPVCECVAGHPEWLYEDPLTAGYPPRVSDYPMERMSRYIENKRWAAYNGSCEVLSYLDFVKLPLARYTMGVPAAQLARELREFSNFWEECRFLYTIRLYEPWYVAFGVLLHLGHDLTYLFRGGHLGRNFLTDSYRGFAPLSPKSPIHNEQAGPLPPFYDKLKGAIDARSAGERERAAELVFDYVENDWYDEHHDFPWHDTFEYPNGGFVGYWCFEVAAINVIHDIDDSALAEHPNYPSSRRASELSH